MSRLTYEQARAAVVAGATLRWRDGVSELRRSDAHSSDGGLTWHTWTPGVAGDFGWMCPLDGTYTIYAPAPVMTPPRDYRAERDALRLRLDEALDAIAELRVEVAYLSKPLPHVCSSQRRANEAEARLRSLSAELRDLADRAYAAPTPTAPKWPAVGETAPWTTVWDHLKTEPRARYKTPGYNLKWCPRESAVVVSDGCESGRAYTREGRAHVAEYITYTRLPDAESP